ncbi:uncharacterized protein BDR25DRAFT_303399 [Lindgomyces ingoldianus]|uniref:Uncharacterized protein n=1 Tax=Lindgomyces ingoldianus TaxID=673940 RepID=A0ACB6QWJ7_9PLEO|nr:uncharacterized protein BDR25DRAFT_303399 [Lindgomyces ingoldianus]KAF2471374.1 hypothetical protein BDR25DRAFT_303399 [Lindgomyces ingoldianus]
MDFNHYASDSKRGSTINPADLHNTLYSPTSIFDSYGAPEVPSLSDLSAVDSAVDLTSFGDQWTSNIKMEPFGNYVDLRESPQISNTASPSNDMIFSNANSPGGFVRDQSQTSSPETTNDLVGHDNKPPVLDMESLESMFPTPEAIHISQNVDTPPNITLCPDKTKTRAETQIKVQLTVDPLDARFQYIHFPRKTLAKPKLLASVEEKQEINSKGESLHMDVYLVCATAVDEPERLEQALHRARGEEPVPRRPAGVPIAELDKEDPAHPQNGGEVLICEGCKERERKRYDRKKKRVEDEDEWWSYEGDRVIMINEKEYKKWKDVDSESQFTSGAKQVEFAMRIACYCRHQEEKSPMGYRVIFTFKDSLGYCIAQHTSEVFQITDDHKNKEIPPEAMPRPLNIPQPYVQTQYPHAHNVVPIYQYPVETQYAQPAPMNPYSQPPTPIASNFQSPISPMEAQFSQSTTPAGPSSRPVSQTFNASSSFPMHGQFEQAALSPTNHGLPIESYLPRPVSMDNFNFSSSIQYPHQGFASAPQSAVSTPLNLSRPASPTWEQGPAHKKKMMCVYFYVNDE